MAVIKSAKSGRHLKEAIVLDLGDLGRQAERMLASARAEAARMIEQAHVQAKKLTQSAEERGYAEGIERGKIDGLAAGQLEGHKDALARTSPELQKLVQQWNEALQTWESKRNEMFNDAREDVISFSFALAKKIVNRMVQSDPTIVRDQLVHALSLLSRPTAIEVFINPLDRPLIEEAMPQLLEAIKGCKHVSVHEDSSMLRGGCVAATAGGSGGGRVDATIDTQLDRIAEALVPHNPRFDAITPTPEMAVQSPPQSPSESSETPLSPNDDSGPTN